MSSVQEIVVTSSNREGHGESTQAESRTQHPTETEAVIARSDDKAKGGNGEGEFAASPPTTRRRLPDERRSITHKFTVGGQEGYLTVGLYDDGVPGEIFIAMSKEGSTVSGLMDAFATCVSLALQYGVPL
jgi:ribonucleoside-diphosphate reductase alpha chain